MSIFSKIFSGANNPETAYKSEVTKINSFGEDVAKLSQDEIKSEIAEFKKDLQHLTGTSLHKKLSEIRPRVFALVRESSKRAIGQFHYDVQLMGGLALSEGKIAEMKTGEGKTLTATLPLVLFALAGRGAHLVTVNDYLSRWQASLMGPLFLYLGLSVSSIQHDQSFLFDPEYQPDEEEIKNIEAGVEGLVMDVKHMRPVTRREAYNADITYGTNNEFGFDYLRDNMAPSQDRLVQRDLFYAIVDEVDSILIDEARTPLIISAPDTEPTSKYVEFARLVNQLVEGSDFIIDEKRKVSSLTDEGINKIEKLLRIPNIYDTSKGVTTIHHIEQALRAKANYLKDKDYVVRNDEVVIVDEFTGRLMFGRRYSEGLHQAIEAKENVKIQQESRTLATITFQNLFRLYERLAGMTGTAKTEDEEFFKIYNLHVVQIPTNRPMVRKDLEDVIYKTEVAKFKAIATEVRERHQKGQPVLIGTVSIAKNEELAKALEAEGVPFELLNAKQHEREAHIISQAGRLGAVTLATNIAGRGVDILLGGNPIDPDNAKQVRDVGGLHVLGTERHESRRIDNQLRGRAGRQGDPGSSQFFVSMEDELMRLFGGERMKKMMTTLGLPDNEPIGAKLVSRSIESAQKKIEGLNFDTRKHVLEFDDVLNFQRKVIYKRRRRYLISKVETPNTGEDSEPGVEIGELAEDTKSIKEDVLGIIQTELSNIVTTTFAIGDDPKAQLEQVFKEVSGILNVTPELTQRIHSATENSANLEFAVAEELNAVAEELYNKREEEIGKDNFEQLLRAVVLQSIDTFWMEHLDTMDHLRDSVRLRGYGQRDPLVEYKREGYQMFQRLQADIDKQIASIILRVEIRAVEPQPQTVNMVTNLSDGSSPSPSSTGKEPGRNDPCPCGAVNHVTGQVYKWKKCGMINAPHHKK